MYYNMGRIFSSCISCLVGLSMFLYLLKLISTSQDVTGENLKQLTSWLDILLTVAVDINWLPSRTFDIIRIFVKLIFFIIEKNLVSTVLAMTPLASESFFCTVS